MNVMGWLRRARFEILLLVVVAALVGFLAGRQTVTSVHTAMALSAEGAISAESDGWTYGIPVDVAWRDASGSWHEGDRPDCLPPTGAEVGPVTFGSVDATMGGVSWRPVIWVDCRR